MDYLASLERAIQYIETHLEEEIHSQDIARAAGYSWHHLIHIFKTIVGEPVGSYVQKRRLSNAARLLLHTDERVLDIALKSGFSSSEAFSRAFKLVYGVSPFAYRQNEVEFYIGSKKKLDTAALRHLSTGLTVKPFVVEMPDIYVVGLQGKTSVLQNTLPQLWARLHQLENVVCAKPGARRFGICETKRTDTIIGHEGDVRFTETAAFETEADTPVPAGMVSKTLKGGRYAVFTHTGTIATLRETYDYIWGSWILATKETLAEREDYEIYSSRFLGADNPLSEIDIYIPVTG